MPWVPTVGAEPLDVEIAPTPVGVRDAVDVVKVPCPHRWRPHARHVAVRLQTMPLLSFDLIR